MALLQVRDFPKELYTLLMLRAEMENRSLTQQTIYMLKKDLTEQDNPSENKRIKAMNALAALNLSLPAEARTPVDLIREDRDR